MMKGKFLPWVGYVVCVNIAGALFFAIANFLFGPTVLENRIGTIAFVIFLSALMVSIVFAFFRHERKSENRKSGGK